MGERQRRVFFSFNSRTNDVIPKQIMKNFKGRSRVTRRGKEWTETVTGYNVYCNSLTVE